MNIEQSVAIYCMYCNFTVKKYYPHKKSLRRAHTGILCVRTAVKIIAQNIAGAA